MATCFVPDTMLQRVMSCHVMSRRVDAENRVSANWTCVHARQCSCGLVLHVICAVLCTSQVQMCCSLCHGICWQTFKRHCAAILIYLLCIDFCKFAFSCSMLLAVRWWRGPRDTPFARRFLTDRQNLSANPRPGCRVQSLLV